MKATSAISSFFLTAVLATVVVAAGCATQNTPLENSSSYLPERTFTHEEPFLFTHWLLKTPSLMPEPHLFRDTPYLSVPTLERGAPLLPEPNFRSTSTPIFVQ